LRSWFQDVAARGLDVPKVDTVVQYTAPTSTQDYVHRIGRTGRAGSSGTATVFLTPPEVEFARMLESRRIRIKQEDMDDVLRGLMDPLSPYRSACDAAVALQNKFEDLVLDDKKLYAMACKGRLLTLSCCIFILFRIHRKVNVFHPSIEAVRLSRLARSKISDFTD
jgi:hypothetical protein